MSTTNLRVLSKNCKLLSTIQEEGDSIVLRNAAKTINDYANMIERLQELRKEILKTPHPSNKAIFDSIQLILRSN